MSKWIILINVKHFICFEYVNLQKIVFNSNYGRVGLKFYGS